MGGRILTLGVSGKLWRNSLVMVDRETGSLWSQVTGEAIAGPLEGEKLPKLAATGRESTFADWKDAAGTVKVLEARGRTTPRQDVYESYHRGSETGIRARERSDHRLPLKTMVLGFSQGDEAWALPDEAIPDGETRRVRLGSHRVEVKNAPEGVRILGSTPQGLEVMEVYWFVWADFHPESVVLGADAVERVPPRSSDG